MKSFTTILEGVILTLPLLKDYHAHASGPYALLRQICRKEVKNAFGKCKMQSSEFKPFGKFKFPYYKMGATDSLNLFDLDELIIFSYYWLNRNRYKKVADIGANIGLHSIILNKCGYTVSAYEPDPRTFEILRKNLVLNNCGRVRTFNAAVSSKPGEKEFIRVLGNITGSHLAGSKSNPYGKLEKFPVNVVAIGPLLRWADLIKLDTEGHEKEILLSTNEKDWIKTDALVEVENESNARAIYEHFKSLKVNLFSQKNNWNAVKSITNMPSSYREGSLFISPRKEMLWHAKR